MTFYSQIQALIIAAGITSYKTPMNLNDKYLATPRTEETLALLPQIARAVAVEPWRILVVTTLADTLVLSIVDRPRTGTWGDFVSDQWLEG